MYGANNIQQIYYNTSIRHASYTTYLSCTNINITTTIGNEKNLFANQTGMLEGDIHIFNQRLTKTCSIV